MPTAGKITITKALGFTNTPQPQLTCLELCAICKKDSFLLQVPFGEGEIYWYVG